MNISKIHFLKILEDIKSIDTIEFKDKAEKIRKVLIQSIDYKNLESIFKSYYHNYKEDINYIHKNYSYTITKKNGQLEPKLIIGFEHGSYNNDCTAFSMLCNAKRINYNLIELCDNPEYYFGGEGEHLGIDYSCYSKKKDSNLKFYTITSGAHRSTIAMFLSNIFYNENIIKINKVPITEYFVNYELSHIIDNLYKIVKENKDLLLEIRKSSFFVENDSNTKTYYFNIITSIELIDKNDSYKPLFTKSFNYDETMCSQDILRILKKNESELINIFVNTLFSLVKEHIKIKKEKKEKKENCICTKIFTFTCKLLFK